MKSTSCFLMMIALVTLTGCNERLFSYKGSTITQEKYKIQLQQGGDQQGIWETSELALNYHYQMTPEVLKLSGTVRLIGGFRIGFNSIDRLVVQLLFLDDHGTVIDNMVVYSAEYRRPIDMTPMIYDKTIRIPPNCRAISFTYDGKLMGGDASVDIWYFPS